MLKRPITYTFIDDDEKEVTETEIFYFHLFEEELLEWESKYKEGLGATLQRMIQDKDQENIFAFFKKIILQAYGVRAEGGRSFNKSDELRKAFENTLAYRTLFKELSTNEGVAAEFINGIFPKFAAEQDKPQIQAAIETKPV